MKNFAICYAAMFVIVFSFIFASLLFPIDILDQYNIIQSYIG